VSRIHNLLASSDPIPTQGDAAWDNYNNLEQRLFVKSGGDKFTLLQLYRRVKGRGAFMSPAGIGVSTIVEGAASTCPPEYSGNFLISDDPETSGAFGSGVKQVENELFVGERLGRPNDFFQYGLVQYFTRTAPGADWTFQSEIQSNDLQNASSFGRDIDYDGSRIIVGESGGIGSADVFTFTGGVETFEQKITPDDATDTNQQFGISVALDGSHALIGAPNRDGVGLVEGAVEYWSESGGTWTFQQTLTTNGGPSAGDGFGMGVTMSDDSTAFISYYPGDGTIKVQKFTRSGSTWTFSEELSFDYVPNGAPNYSRLDTDGSNIILTHNGYDASGTNTNEGLILVFDLEGSVTSEIIGDPGDQLGTSASIWQAEAAVGQEAFTDTNTGQGKVDFWDVCI